MKLKKLLIQDTTTLEFGNTVMFSIASNRIVSNIFLPKYYDPSIEDEQNKLRDSCEIISIGNLVENCLLQIDTGDEIGKMAYGTGEIPFIRTSDFTNWELKSDPKQGVSDEVYLKYSQKEDIQANDILMVRDGTYLIGTSCIITASEVKMLYCGGLLKIRSLDHEKLNPYLLLGLLNSYIVKRQIRTKQFTRDVIDTIGKRINEVYLPIPQDRVIVDKLSSIIKNIIESRYKSKENIIKLAESAAR